MITWQFHNRLNDNNWINEAEDEILDLSTLFADISNSACEEKDSYFDSDSNLTVDTPAYSPLTTDSPASSPEMSTHLYYESDIEPEVILTPPVRKIPFKLVGDNVDKTVKPRHETMDSHAKSLHYFHCFAVRDRLDMSSFEDDPGLPEIGDINVNEVLPTEDDHATLTNNMTILMMRIIQNHILFFKNNVKHVERHIPHCYSTEMAKKSDVVSIHSCDYIHYYYFCRSHLVYSLKMR